MYVTSKSGQKVYMPTPEEDAEITAAALSDPDAQPLTEEEWGKIKHRVKRGRPPAETTKELISIHLSPKVLEEFRAAMIEADEIASAHRTRFENAKEFDRFNLKPADAV